MRAELCMEHGVTLSRLLLRKGLPPLQFHQVPQKLEALWSFQLESLLNLIIWQDRELQSNKRLSDIKCTLHCCHIRKQSCADLTTCNYMMFVFLVTSTCFHAYLYLLGGGCQFVWSSLDGPGFPTHTCSQQHVCNSCWMMMLSWSQ